MRDSRVQSRYTCEFRCTDSLFGVNLNDITGRRIASVANEVKCAMYQSISAVCLLFLHSRFSSLFILDTLICKDGKLSREYVGTHMLGLF